MQFLFFVIFYPLLWSLSILPFWLLYKVSDGVFVLIYYIIGYRRKTVRENLAMAFPHLSVKERRQIEIKSYRHLCDMFLEMIKTMNLSQEEMRKRFRFTNIEEYQKLENKGKSIALMLAHYASYEWAISMNHFSRVEGFAIYKRIANPYFDKVVRNIRSKFQATLITTKETTPTLLHNQAIGKQGSYGFASDQSPKASKAHHWTQFLGIHTPVHTGAELLSKKFDMSMIFLRVKKLRRGYYEATLEILTENPREIPDYQITDEFMRRVELQIREAPEYYLWTHKRWKYAK